MIESRFERVIRNKDFQQLPHSEQIEIALQCAEIDSISIWMQENEWLSKFTINEINFIGPVLKRKVVFTNNDLREIDILACNLTNRLRNSILDMMRTEDRVFIFQRELDDFNRKIEFLKLDLLHRITRLKLTHSKANLSVSGTLKLVEGYQTLEVTITEEHNGYL